MRNRGILFWEGVALLIGTIVGAGYLVLPYSFLQAGIWQNLMWFFVFAFCVTGLHLLYAEIVLATKESHRLPGYVGLYLGRFPELVSISSFIFGVFGGLLVYLLLGSRFFQLLLAPFHLNIPAQVLTVVFWALASSLVIAKVNVSGKINLAITVVTMSLFILASAMGFLHSAPQNFSIPATKPLFFPYGLILYALTGALAIPEIIRVLRKQDAPLKMIKPIAIVGTLIPIAVYILFSLGIMGASGVHTSQDAISGMAGALPPWLIYAVVIAAFLEIITSYFTFGIYTVETLRRDFSMKKFWAALVVVLLPITMFGIGVDDFVKLIGVLGSVLATIDSLSILGVYLAIKIRRPDYKFQVANIPGWVIALFAVLFLIGGVLGFVYTV